MNGSAWTASEVCEFLKVWWACFGFIELTVDTNGACTLLKVSGKNLEDVLELGQDINGFWDVVLAEGIFASLEATTSELLGDLLTSAKELHG